MPREVIQKLKNSKQQKSGFDDFTLPGSDVKVEWPKFLEHGVWQSCLRMSKNDIHTAQVRYVCKIATFDGEKIAVADWNKLIPLSEANELLAKIFVGEDDDDWGDDADDNGDAGNGQKTKA